MLPVLEIVRGSYYHFNSLSNLSFFYRQSNLDYMIYDDFKREQKCRFQRNLLICFFFIYINLSTNLTSRRWGSRSPQRVRRKGPLLRRLARSEVSAGADPREVPGAAEHALPGPCQLDRASRHRQDVHRHAKRQKRWVQSPCQIGGKYF